MTPDLPPALRELEGRHLRGAIGTTRHWNQCKWCNAYTEAQAGSELRAKHRTDCPVGDFGVAYALGLAAGRQEADQGPCYCCHEERCCDGCRCNPKFQKAGKETTP